MNTLLHRIRRNAGLILVLLAGGSAVVAQTPPVLGQPAPPLRLAEWWQGAPVERFEPGTVYVLEFWATWCGYCIQAMPHLSALSEHYGDRVVFLGVDVMERPPRNADSDRWISQTVSRFLTTDHGKKMTYRTGRDTPDKFMEKTWLPGAAQVDYPVGAIPVTFIVDAQGRVAWIGHPFLPEGAMDQALAQIVAGEFDVGAFAASKQNERAQRLADQAKASSDRANEVAPLLEPVKHAAEAEDWPRVITEAHNAIAMDPRVKRETFQARLKAFRALTQTDPAKALSLFDHEVELSEQPETEMSVQVADIASVLVSTPDWPAADYQRALAVIEARDPAGRPLTWRWVHALAEGYWNSAQYAKGAALQEKVLGHTEIVEHMTDEAVEAERAMLRKFQSRL